MKIINNVHDLMVSINRNTKKIYLDYTLYDWLLLSNWECILSGELKEYVKTNQVIRVGESNGQ